MKRHYQGCVYDPVLASHTHAPVLLFLLPLCIAQLCIIITLLYQMYKKLMFSNFSICKKVR